MVGPQLNDYKFEEHQTEAYDRPSGYLIAGSLFELLIILLLRHLLDHQLRAGMMAGLADTRLVRSFLQMHNSSECAWSIAELASESDMSRAARAVHFKSVIGQTPAD